MTYNPYWNTPPVELAKKLRSGEHNEELLYECAMRMEADALELERLEKAEENLYEFHSDLQAALDKDDLDEARDTWKAWDAALNPEGEY